MTDLGNRLAELMNETGIKSVDLANAIGVSFVSVSRYLHGTRVPKQKTLVKIAEYFGVPAYSLVAGQEGLKAECDCSNGNGYARTASLIRQFSKSWSVHQNMLLIRMLTKTVEEQTRDKT